MSLLRSLNTLKLDILHLIWLILVSARASIILTDPSDYINLAADAEDNALRSDYANPGPEYLMHKINSTYYYTNSTGHLSHKTLSASTNDTSVIVGASSSTLKISHSVIEKTGYSTSLNQASFYGVNSAIVIANASTAFISHANITTHNGAANIFAYGDNTTVYVENTDLYTSGPVAHGLYAAGNAIIHGSNIRAFTGGNRCSVFSGDKPGGDLYIRDSVAHTTGIGSAIFYTVGESRGENIVGVAENSPALFSDGAQESYFRNVDFTAGLLAGTVLFSSASERRSGAVVEFEDSKLTVTGEEMPGLWFGNVVASASIVASEIRTVSGVLVMANTSRITPEFDHFAGVEYTSAIEPAVVDVTVEESELVGDIVAFNGSSISWTLRNYSTWTGAAVLGGEYGSADFLVDIDETSTWVLTGDVELQEFRNGDVDNTNIVDSGYDIYYNSSAEGNGWLEGRSFKLQNGGYIRPGIVRDKLI
ncbi:hypothetical protein BDV18DRAFT_158271 [Aspergillus unguis]